MRSLKNNHVLSNVFKKKFLSNLNHNLPIILSSGYLQQTVVITVKPRDLIFVLNFLKLQSQLQYNLLTAVSCVDYPFRKNRFEVAYELLSVRFNSRIRVKTFVDEVTPLQRVVSVFPASTWWEREIWDLFGVFF